MRVVLAVDSILIPERLNERIRRYKKTMLLGVLLMVNTSIQATTWYFSSSTGSDSYTADQAKNQATPWQTINKLNSIMSTLQPGDSVLFKRNDRFPGSVTIKASGSAGHPITFGAYGPGASKPVLDNRLTLTGWINLGGNIWEATSSNLNGQPTALMINDVLQPLGRYPNIDAPNRGYLTITSHPTGSKTVFTDNTLSSTPNWTGAEVVIRNTRWILNRIIVANHSGQTITLIDSILYEITDKYGYFFQNHPATLDKDGEWCYMKSGNKIRLYLSTDPNAHVINTANNDYYFNIDSKAYLVIDCIAMIGAKKSALNLNKVSYCTIKNCDFSLSGSNAINMGPIWTNYLNDSITISNNTITNTQSNCINAFGKRIAITGNTLKNTGMVPGMGESGQKYMGIWTLADGLLIERNVIDSTGYIPIDFTCSGNMLIKENFINRFCTVTDDGGGIYGGTSPSVPERINRKILNNIVLRGVGAPEGTNSSFSSAEGIYIDVRTPNVEVIGNTVAFCNNSGILLHNAPKCTVKNNIVYSCGKALWINHDDIAPNFPVISCEIQNNQLVNNSPDTSIPLISYNTIDETSFAKLGILDNNFYCLPFQKNEYIKYQISHSSPLKSLSFDLSDWQTFSGYDQHTLLSPRSYPLVETILSDNQITNSNFSANTNGWSKWDPPGNSSALSWVNGQLDGGCLSFTVTGSGGVNSSILKTTLPSITKGKSYLLQLSARATGCGSINCYLIQNISPYPNGSAAYTVKIDSVRSDYEIIIMATATLSTPSLFISIGPEDGTVYLDNIAFYEVIPSNPDDYIRFEYNTSSTPRIITADKDYITPAGISYTNGSRITIPAFSSVVLLKDVISKKDAILTNVKSLNTSEEKRFKLFPNPADDQVYIDGIGPIPADVAIYDLSGRVIRRETVKTAEPLDISAFRKGIYLFRISGNNHIETLKLVKI